MLEKPNKKKKRLNRYLALTSIPFQIGITVYLGAYIGEYFDGVYQFQKPWFTIVGVLFSLIVSMYSVVKQLNKLNKS